MRLSTIAGRLLASAAIFGLSLAKPLSAQDEKAKRSESYVVAPKVFIIDMVGLTVLDDHCTQHCLEAAIVSPRRRHLVRHPGI